MATSATSLARPLVPAPILDVTIDFSVRVQAAHAEGRPRVREIPHVTSTLSIPGSRTVSMGGATGCTPLLPTSFLAKFSHAKGLYCGEKADPIEKELATWLADLLFFFGSGVRVLSSPADKFCSSLGCNTISER